MATLEQLEAALIKADAAGNAEDARAFANEIRRLRTEPPEAPRPAVDPSGPMDANDARSRFMSPEATARRVLLAARQGPVDRFVNAAGDAVMGIPQLAARAIEPVLGSGPREAIDGAIRQSAEDRRVGMLARGENPYSFSPVEIAGAVAGGVATGAPAKQAATWLGRTGQAVFSGARAGAASSVQDTDNFAQEKTNQVALGAAAGGVLQPVAELAVRAVAPAVNAITRAIKTRSSPLGSEQVDNLISQSLQREGVQWASLAEDVRDGLRAEVSQALRAGGKLNEKELARLADISAVGATPTRGAVTLDPVQITAERNLAKAGANSNDPQLQRLARVEQENNQALIQRINRLQGGSPADEYATGAKLIKALRDKDEQAGQTVKNLYQQARDSSGKEASVSLQGVAQDYANILRDFGDKVPSGVRNNFEQLGLLRGQQTKVFTVEDADRLLKVINANQSNDPATNAALSSLRSSVRRALTEGGDDVFSRPRAAAAARFKSLEETPALQAAIDGAEPDQFVRKYIVGSSANVADVNALRRATAGSPEALEAVRGQIVNHLKSRALNGATDEVGNFSQSAFNKALNDIGDRKLSAFFSPEEVAQLRQIGRAASYLQVQPKGSAVNNSNTASTAIGLLDRVVSRLPFGDAAVRQPINNLLAQRQAANSLRPPVATTPQAIDEETLARILGTVTPVGGALGVALSQ